MVKENKIERAKTVVAMEQMCRCIIDERIFDIWLQFGVADGDINENTTFNEVVSLGYCEDDVFSKLMSLFLRLMRKAEQYGGLYSDNIVSN